MKEAHCMSQRLETFIVKGLVSMLSDFTVPAGTEADGKIEVEIPGPLASIAKYVKGGGDETGIPVAGRVGAKAAAATIINFLPYSQRSFLIYIADLASALQLLPNVQEEKGSLAFPFAKQIGFLNLVDAVKDCHRCPSEEVIAASQKLVLLCSNDSYSDMIRFDDMM
jgi:hypothetical protein